MVSPGLTPPLSPSVLLHVCCASCATHVIESLLPSYEVIGFFFNPNISPKAEFLRRLKDACRVCAHYHVRLWIPPYREEAWSSAVRGLEDRPEGGERCTVCFRLRLEETARCALRNSIGSIATTLTVSPHKNADVINEVGRSLAARYSITFLDRDFKKKDGFLRSVSMSRELGLYRQSYCGCPSSYKNPHISKRGERR